MRRVIIALAAAVGLSGCTYERNHGPQAHFYDFKTQEPRGNTVTVCAAYGCKVQTRVTFSKAHIAEISQIMEKTRKADTPDEERRAVAYAIGWMERHTGAITGTSADRPGMEYAGSGDPTQQDCVDEATNTTSYLLVLQNNGFLRHHKVGTPFSKGNLLLGGIKQWPHWTAVLLENNSGTRYAVDSWNYENGENPAIVDAREWYIDDLDNLPKSTT
ncbi:MAG: hypothetical protein GC150_05955 [Rhizobiales bacterium]|nr:hypothetical protein [Hyphomicrobiales bacterium]